VQRPKRGQSDGWNLLPSVHQRLDEPKLVALASRLKLELHLLFGVNRFVNGERGISLDTAAMLCDFLDLDLRPRR